MMNAQPSPWLSHHRPVGASLSSKTRASCMKTVQSIITVSTSNLTMDVEAAFRWTASRGDSQTTHTIILTDSMSLLQKVKSGMGSLDWNVSMVDIHLRKLLWVYCPGHARMAGNDQSGTLTGKVNLTSGLLLERSEVLRSLRHYLRA